MVLIMKEEVKNNLYDVYCDAYSKASDEVLHGKTLGEVLEVVSDSNTKLVQKFLHHICTCIEKNSELGKKEIQDFVVKNIILDRLFDDTNFKWSKPMALIIMGKESGNLCMLKKSMILKII